ncbi:MAG TPA: hypothetical protein VF172_10470 [Nitrososphaera sp.]|jgi:hypothetical protein
MAGEEGPAILWEKLKGKRVCTNDGKELGEIKEIAENYILLEKGLVNKDKYWIPKYVIDAYDGKVLWLLISSEDVAKGYSHTSHPEKEQYSHGFETFKTTRYGQRTTYLSDFNQKVRIAEERDENPEEVGGGYRNVRDPER